MTTREEIRVLLAEDDFYISEMLKVTLEKRGYTVVGEASNGPEAVELAQFLHPDVVLMDIKMPKLNGIEATRQIHQLCPTPVVVLTAFDTPELVDQASEAGVGAYLVKPHNIREMERAIEIAIARFKDMMELRRLYAELKARDEERKRAIQLELVSSMIQEISSMLYQDELLFQVARLIRDTFGYHTTSILLADDGSDELVLRAAAGPLSKNLLEHLRLEQGRSKMADWIERVDGTLSDDDFLLLTDVDDNLGYFPYPEGQGGRSILAVPIKRDGHFMGVLDVQSVEPDVLGRDDALALKTLAGRLAVAIENAQLYQQTDRELQARVRELASLYAIAETMNRTHDLDTILKLVLSSTIELMGVDSGGIMLLDSAHQALSVRHYQGHLPGFVEAMGNTNIDEGLMPRMLGSVLVIDDLAQLLDRHRLPIETEGLQCVVSIPIKLRDNVLGVIVLASRRRRTFDDQELALCAAIGNQLGLAVERTNLQAQELRVAILEERQTMARQMHDDIAQTLGYLGLQVDGVMRNSSLVQNIEVQNDLEEIRRAIDDAYRRVGSSIVRLREDVPRDFDLRTTLQDRIARFVEQTGCKVESELDDVRLSRLSSSTAFQVSYIIHEALTNVRKHSGAECVRLLLDNPEPGVIEIAVQDDGRGFSCDENELADGSTVLQDRRFGLRFMKERAERVGGCLEIKSGINQGTRIVIRLPVNDQVS